MRYADKNFISEFDKISKHFKIVNKLPNIKTIEKEATRAGVVIYSLQPKNFNSWCNFMHTNSVENIDRSLWTGVHKFTDYTDILDNGNEELISKIRDGVKGRVKELHKEFKKELSGYNFDVSGEFFDIGLFLSGIPEVWLEPEYIDIEKHRIKIKINNSYSSDYSMDEITANFIELLSVLSVLEKSMGIEVKLVFINASTDFKSSGNQLFYVEQILKDYSEPFNWKKISSMFGAYSLRRGIFYVYECLAGDDVRGGKGKPIKFNLEDGVINISSSEEVRELKNKLIKGL